MIEKLCKRYTNLTDDDIAILEEFSAFLPVVAEAQGCDAFIDCSTHHPDSAIVVAEYRPENSLYKNNVVGMYAKRANEPAALRTLETGIPSRGLKGLTQENKAIIQHVSAIRNADENVIGVLIMERDETEFFNKEFLAEEMASHNSISKESYKDISITQYLDDAIIYFNNEGTVIYANPRASIIFSEMGYREQLVGMPFQNVVLGSVKFGEIVESKYINLKKFNLGSKMFNLKYYTMADGDIRLGVAMIIEDHTDFYIIEQELMFKTVGIKEIHHRVKNNLQTIASLLRLQARRLDESPEKKILNENINRIISISLTHEILAQNGEDDVAIKGIIEKLIVYISNSSLPSNSNIRTVVTGEDIFMKSEIATNVSLVINELIQNSYEHAFKDVNEGNLNIVLENDGHISTIVVEDDGVGFDIYKEKKDSLGLVIVDSMITEKLGGELKIDTGERGTKVTISFPI